MIIFEPLKLKTMSTNLKLESVFKHLEEDGNWPNEYRQSPINFLYAFLKAILGIMPDEKLSCSHKKAFYEMYEYTGPENTVFIFEKEGNIYSLKIYLQKYGPPNFEKDYGYDENYTGRNLLIITFNKEKGDQIKVRTHKKFEDILTLDPFKKYGNSTDYPFEEKNEFAAFFWESYKDMMERQLLEKAVY